MKYCILAFVANSLAVVGPFDTAEAARTHGGSQAETLGAEIPDYPGDVAFNSLAGWAVTTIDEPTAEGPQMLGEGGGLTQSDDAGNDTEKEEQVEQAPSAGAATA